MATPRATPNETRAHSATRAHNSARSARTGALDDGDGDGDAVSGVRDVRLRGGESRRGVLVPSDAVPTRTGGGDATRGGTFGAGDPLTARRGTAPLVWLALVWLALVGLALFEPELSGMELRGTELVGMEPFELALVGEGAGGGGSSGGLSWTPSCRSSLSTSRTMDFDLGFASYFAMASC